MIKVVESTLKKVAIVTGASSGIGRELCLQLAKEGYDIGLVARRRDLLVELASSIEELGRHAVVMPCDVADSDQMVGAVESIEQRLGTTDLLIANAGIGADLVLKDFDAGEARKIYEVNVIGLMQSIAAVLPGMIERRRGHIVGISSLASFVSFPRTYVYCASKHAVNAHLDGLRLEARRYNIDVTTVCPGFVKTPLTAKNRFPMPLLMEVETAAHIIIKGVKKRKRMIIFPKRLYWLIQVSRLLPMSLRSLVMN